MAKKSKKPIGTAVAVGSGIGAVAGAALGAAAVAIADKNVRDETMKTAKRVGNQAARTLNKAGKTVSSYQQAAGALGGKSARKSTKSGTKKKSKK